jgi:hypothetical protein
VLGRERSEIANAEERRVVERTVQIELMVQDQVHMERTVQIELKVQDQVDGAGGRLVGDKSWVARGGISN